MLRYKKDRVEWLEFDLLAAHPRIKHAVFLRRGGVSEGCFNSLNVGLSSGDDHAKVMLNRALLCKEFVGCELVTINQEHGRETHWMGDGKALKSCDGIISDLPNQGLMIQHADCQAAIFYDPRVDMIACVHAGWRGLVANIYAATVQEMVNRGSRVENICIGISPGLGPCCAEFVNYQAEFPEQFWEFQVTPRYFDLWEIAKSQLLQQGILPRHIEIIRICTCCTPADFFSYRRDKKTGRHGTVIALRGDK